jgi:hypothetical protein
MRHKGGIREEEVEREERGVEHHLRYPPCTAFICFDFYERRTRVACKEHFQLIYTRSDICIFLSVRDLHMNEER